MEDFSISVVTACMAIALGTATVTMAEAPAPLPKGEGVVASVEATATVKTVDQKTRELTAKMEDGEERSFVASEDVNPLSRIPYEDVPPPRVKLPKRHNLALITEGSHRGQQEVA